MDGTLKNTGPRAVLLQTNLPGAHNAHDARLLTVETSTEPGDLPQSSRWLRISGAPEPDWDQRWLQMAAHIASWSKDPRTQVGCVLVRGRRRVAEGYNGFPYGIADTQARYDDPDTKYVLVVHAEANAIAHAADFGVQTRGATAYVTYPCCPRCATLLIQAGVNRVVTPAHVLVPERYRKDAELGWRVLREAGVPYEYRPTFESGDERGEWERRH